VMGGAGCWQACAKPNWPFRPVCVRTHRQVRPDFFHLLREAGRLTQRLERAAYQAIEMAKRARRAAREAQDLVRRRGALSK